MAFHGCDPAVLRQLLKEARLKFREGGKSYVFTCPRCQKKDKLYIRKSDGRFVCWSCKETEGYQGRAEYALADLLGQTVRQVCAKLYGGSFQPVHLYLDVHFVDFFGDDEDDEDAVEPPVLTWPCDYYEIDAPEAARGAAYLEGRGVPVHLAKEYGVRYCPLKRRVVFPVESQGKLYGWQERLVIPHQFVDEDGNDREIPKILSSDGIPRERVLMFADRLTGSRHAVLCEGPVDAIKAHLCGGNVSPMGKAVNPEQMNIILNAGVEAVYLGLDPDAADETARLVRNHFDDVRLYQLVARVKGADEKPDLGAMTYEEVRDLFLGAKPIHTGQLFVFFDPRVAR